MNVRQYLSKTTTMILLCLMTSCLAYGNGSGDSIATDTVMLGKRDKSGSPESTA